MSDRKYGTDTGRSAAGRFAPGNPGRPRGATNKTTRAIEALLDGDAEALTRKAVEMALSGDTTALRLCLERLCPPRKDTPVEFAVPELKSAADASAAVSAILTAVADGELTPSQGMTIAGLVATYRKTLETEDLERRVHELENSR